MLEPLRTPLIKTLEEFHERNFKIVGDEIFRSEDPEKAIFDAVISGMAMVFSCKVWTSHKDSLSVVSEGFKSKTYTVKEPVESIAKNLFVPFSNPFVDKFQGKKFFIFNSMSLTIFFQRNHGPMSRIWIA